MDMDKIKDASIVSISKHCHQLKRLELLDCPAISDISIQAIAANCRNRTKLSLHNTVGLSNPSLIADIDRNNIRLKYDCIDVRDCGRSNETPLKEMLQAITAGR